MLAQRCLRRFSPPWNWPVTRRNLLSVALRRCSTSSCTAGVLVFTSETRGSSSPSFLTPPLPPAPSSCTTPSSQVSNEVPKPATDSSTAFAYYFNDVFTTIDIAPVKRPQLSGSLLCSIDDFPFTVLLVEDCTGTSNEAVAYRVQQCAVRVAEWIKASTKQSVRAFLLRHVCERWPKAMRHLHSLDLSLQLKLVPAGAATANITQWGTQADESTEMSPALRGTVSGSSAAAAAPVRWRCSASLYDPWQIEPQLTPLGCPQDSEKSAVAEHALALEGELLTVFMGVMARVQEELSARCAALLGESAGEAACYTREAGHEQSQLWLTSRLQMAAIKEEAERSQRWWWFEDGLSLPSSSWTLSWRCWRDAARNAAVGAQLSLEHVLVSTRAAAPMHASTLLAHTLASRVFVPLVAPKTASEEEDCVYTRGAFSEVSPVEHGEALAIADLAARVSDRSITLTDAWAETPLNVCGEFVEQVAQLSSTIAHDLHDSERCGEDVLGVCLFGRAPTTAGTLEAPQLPNAVRWTSFEGRRVIEEFVAAAAPRNATTGFHLPPLWPRVTGGNGVTDTGRRATFRELIRNELGLRHLPRTDLSISTAGKANEVFVCDVDVVAGWRAPNETAADSLVPPARLRIGADWYVDVAEAAQAHTPWALPLCTLPPTAAEAAAVAKGNKSEKGVPSIVSVQVLSIPDSLRLRGVLRATWDESAGELLCFTDAPHKPPLRFSNLPTVKGFTRLLRFCANTAVYTQAFYRTQRAPHKALASLLRFMMTDGNAPEASEAGGTSRNAEHHLRWPKDSDDRLIAVLPLPFHAGTTRLTASSHMARAVEVRRLISLVQHFCKDPSAFAPLLAATTISITTFFQVWDATEPWLHPCGPLRIALSPNAAMRGRSHEREEPGRCEGGTVQRSMSPDDNNGDARSLTLCIGDAFSEDLSNGSDSGEATAALNSGDGVHPLRELKRVCLPASGGRWVSEAYTAIRDAALSLPPAVIEKTQKRSSPHRRIEKEGEPRLLLLCTTLTELLQVTLCMLLNDGMCRSRTSPVRLLFALFRKNLGYLKRSKGYELRLQVTPDTFVLLAACSAECHTAKPEQTWEGWRELLAFTFLEEAAPEVLKSLSTAHQLQLFFTEMDSHARNVVDSVVLHLQWKANPACAPGAGDADDLPRLLFTVEVSRADVPPASPAPSPAAAAAKSETVYKASGSSLTDVLQRVLEDYLLPARKTYATVGSDNAALPLRGMLCADNALTSMQRKLAVHLHLQRVSVQFDAEASRLRLLGWKEPNKSVEEADDSRVVLADEAATLDRVPLIIFRLHRQLLQRVDQSQQEMTVEELCSWSRVKLFAQLCQAWGCTESDFQATSVLQNKQWLCEVALPLHLIPLTQCATALPPASCPKPSPEKLYVSCSSNTKRKSERWLLACLCHWTCYAQTAGIDYEGRYGVRCSATRSALRRATTMAPTRKDFVPSLIHCSDNEDNDDGDGAAHGSLPIFPMSSQAAWPRSASPLPSSAVDSKAPAQVSVARISLLDSVHAKVKMLLAELVDRANGRVVLQLSQTFGLELLFEVLADRGSAEGETAMVGDGSVQLLRERWSHGTWAPAQVLRAEALVLAQLVCRDADAAQPDRAQLLHIATSELLRHQLLWNLKCGAHVSRRDFCVSFLRRYFGWRVCEQADLADLPITSTQGNIVVYESIAFAAPPHLRRGESGKHARGPKGSRASLRLGQIVSPGDSTVRLAQVLVEVEDAVVDVTRGLLWDACARRVKEVFGVSRLMTAAEVDARMLCFMQQMGL
ncbi:hypothetical protein ABL78_5040 [Leptomonas seymouri]|uniref:Uncharacterized protein n=1 Tax=Leptomonas seymouri TaxID=5684 RepID=A0A0N1PDP8_LEPSE|nr:hypothetical protein ABL78_5040 [Leptomonas seymouri]|eukprot:KPI85908.1 hypothetical protein ABL78_5040 [Leptomonas seymouri]